MKCRWLTGTRGAHQQGTLGDLGTQCSVLVRILQEVNDLLQLKLGTIAALQAKIKAWQ